MSEYRETRKRRTSPALFITFVLGFLIGLTTFYAMYRSIRRDAGTEPSEQPPAVATTVEAPEPTAPETPAQSEADVPPIEESIEETIAGTAPEMPAAEEASPEAPATPEAAPPEEIADVVPAAHVPPPPVEPTPPSPWPARHLFIGIEGMRLDDATRSLLHDLKPGGVVLEAENFASSEQVRNLIKAIKQSVGLGETLADLPLIAVCQEGGDRNCLGLREAPSPADLSVIGDPELAKAAGARYGAAAVGDGIAVLLSPSLDVYVPGTGEVALATRTFGSDQVAVTEMGLAFAEGVMDSGALPVVKHYPGQGAAQRTPDDVAVVAETDPTRLAQFLFPFKEAVAKGLPGLMVGHAVVPALNPDDPMRPASLSPVLVRTLLRDRWAYDGIVITDDLRAPTMTRAVEGAAVEALAAGCDAVQVLLYNPSRIRALCAAIEGAVDDGLIAPDALDESKRRLDAWQDWLREQHDLPEYVPSAVPVEAPPEPVQLASAQQGAEPTLSEEPPQVPATPPATPAEEASQTAEPSAEMPSETPSPEASVESKVEDVPAEAPKAATTPEPESTTPAPEIAEPVDEASPAIPETEQASEESPEQVDTSTPQMTTPEAPEVVPETMPESAAEPTPEPERPAPPEDMAETPSEEAPATEHKAAPEAAEAPDAAATEVPASAEPERPAEKTPAGTPQEPEQAPAVPEAPESEQAAQPAAEKALPPETPAEPEPVVEETSTEVPAETMTSPDEPTIDSEAGGADVAESSPAPAEEESPVPAAERPQDAEPSRKAAGPPQGMKKVKHLIQRGDSLWGIAAEYDVAKEDIMRWNKMTSTAIKYGQKLIIYVPDPDAPQESEPPAPDVEQIPPTEESPPPVPAPEAVQPASETSETPEAVIEEPSPTAESAVGEERSPPAPEPEATEEIPAAEALRDAVEAESPPPPPPQAAEEEAIATPEPVVAEESTPPVAESVAEPAAEEPPAEPEPARVKIEYTVTENDTLTGIAIKYHVRVTDLLNWNNLTGPRIISGQVLTIYLDQVARQTSLPGDETAGMVTYEVQSGDTLSAIAARFGVPAQAIMDQNGLRDANHVRLGQKLRIPRLVSVEP